MKVKRVVRTDDGQIEATLMLTPEQATFLMNMGLGVLVQRGAATIVDYTEEQFLAQHEIEQEPQSESSEATTVPAEPSLDSEQKQFLQDVDINLIPKA